MSKELVEPVHRRTILFQHDMNSNVGEQEAWTETSDPDWTSDYYVELDSTDRLVSLKEFKYGILTFDAWSDVWVNSFAGFSTSAVAAVNSLFFNAGNWFSSQKHATGWVSTAIPALTNSTWYHFIIIWCPQFVSLEIFDLGGNSVFYQRHRNPPNVSLRIFFRQDTAGVLRIGAVTVQEGDDPIFFNFRG